MAAVSAADDDNDDHNDDDDGTGMSDRWIVETSVWFKLSDNVRLNVEMNECDSNDFLMIIVNGMVWTW